MKNELVATDVRQNAAENKKVFFPLKRLHEMEYSLCSNDLVQCLRRLKSNVPPLTSEIILIRREIMNYNSWKKKTQLVERNVGVELSVMPSPSAAPLVRHVNSSSTHC